MVGRDGAQGHCYKPMLEILVFSGGDLSTWWSRANSIGLDLAMVKEQMDPDQILDAYQGPCKVFWKQHDRWGEKDFDYNPVTSMHHSKKGSSQRKPMKENGWEVDHKKNESEDISKSVLGKESSSQFLCNHQAHISVAPVNLQERKTNVVDESLLKKLGMLASTSEGIQYISIIKKDAALIDKIEGLNMKVQIFDGSVKSVVLKEKSNAGGAFNPLHKGSVDASIADGGYKPIAIGRILHLDIQPPR